MGRFHFELYIQTSSISLIKIVGQNCYIVNYIEDHMIYVEKAVNYTPKVKAI